MLSNFVSFFTKDFSYERVDQVEPTVVYRDNLNKKPSANNPKKVVRFSAGEKDCKNLERRSHGSITTAEENSGVIRVKVKMTKEEAARFLSKCKEGGVLGFKDVAQELVQIPVNRVSVVSSCSASRCAAVLQSIPSSSK